jgi:hypothetical protein
MMFRILCKFLCHLIKCLDLDDAGEEIFEDFGQRMNV